MASSNTTFKTREAYKAAKELEEARKAGTAPPAVDSDGKIINPHIPEYISQAPWYLKQDGPSLKHQRNHNAKKRKFDSLGKWLPRGQVKGPAATKYRKGACENCGAMTHTVRNCLERPRRRGAKLTGQGIRPDEVVGAVELDFEGKRDRWNGYEESEFDNVRQRFEVLEQNRKKTQEVRGESAENESSDSDDSDESDDANHGAVLQQTGEAAKTSVRNLRIREDTAKYLYNLDLNSAYYDPKSRSMRADPLPNVDLEDKDFAGDNFVRFSGDVSTLAKMELTTMKAGSVGKRLPHLQAEPSRAEAVFRELETRKKELRDRRRADIIKKYGGQEHTVPKPGISDIAQTESYVEYDADGRPKRETLKRLPVSMYREDVLDKNHKAIWGSFYSNGQWGYACCRQTQRNAFCTGEAGRKAAIETEKEMEERVAKAIEKRDPRTLVEQYADRKSDKRNTVGNGEETEEALNEEREQQIRLEKEIRKQEVEEKHGELGDRQRPYNSLTHGFDSHKLSDEAMEAYRLRRQMKDDPMAKFLSRNS
ncbi:Pre-mRNA-splicing factor slu7 [Gracilariopsis chorda]|uniref:Pre-mRNA-splicing factor SLU7 n=1 Tax=Gracilariopsis chorda TaxID=448386 RepID=A0A2V3IZH8_9FLOR|nr:Pre-mRNA-splicing factor slu7 [Gracilariopsis chorda]|eukprot:PXF46540.1 Pre-mRNA-splicing factor slu7 [Gracilariopsis chorda]